MKGLLFIILFGALAFVVYWACASGGGEAIQKKTQAETTGAAHQVTRSGQNLGNSTQKAFKSVDFGKR